MARWTCPITIIEHRRLAFIEADTKAEAIEKLRASDWEELGDAQKFTVRKSGSMKRETD